MSPAVALGRRSGPGSGSGVREKGERDPRGRFPPSIWGKEARRAGIHGGGGQQAAAAMVAPRWGSTAAKVRRESERETRGSYCTSYPGQRQCVEAAPWWPAFGGGGDGGWWR